MFAYIARRILYVVPIALGVTIIIFGLVHIAPGDPLNAVVPPDAPKETVELLIVAYGFDKPIPVQYFLWLTRAMEGDFGISFATGRPVASAIAGGVVNTLILATGAILIGMTFGCLLGAIAGYFQGSWIDKLATGFAIAGVSVPHYWLGLVLVIIFSVELNALPAMGMGPGGSKDWAWDAAHMRHLVLPVITLSVIPIGIITRSVRATVAEILTMEFVQTLEAKGLKSSRIFLHVVANAAPTVLAVSGLQIGYLLGGSILVETVFSWPGTGFLLNDAIFRRDIPLLQGVILVLAMFFVFMNLLVDILQSLIDPRMARG
jgi:peptide/nickel transport system permease protein